MAATPDDSRKDRLSNPESALGGADSVEKTSYVTGSGTSPEARKKGDTSANVSAGGGPNIVAWGVGLVVVVIALIYAFGLFR